MLRSANVEILAHTTAPSSGRDDVRYRRIVEACLEAEEQEDEWAAVEGFGSDAPEVLRVPEVPLRLQPQEDTEKSWSGQYVFPEVCSLGSLPDSIPDSQLVLQVRERDESCVRDSMEPEVAATPEEEAFEQREEKITPNKVDGETPKRTDRVPSTPSFNPHDMPPPPTPPSNRRTVTPQPARALRSQTSSQRPGSQETPSKEDSQKRANNDSIDTTTTSGSYFSRASNGIKLLPSAPPPTPAALTYLPAKAASQRTPTPCITSPDRRSSRIKEFRALPRTLGELFPAEPFLEIHSPEPAVGSNPEVLTPVLKEIEGTPAFVAYSVEREERKIREWERGYWKVDMRTWEERAKRVFWEDLSKAVEKGRLGFVEVFPDEDVLQDDVRRCDSVRVYCFGCVVRHVWSIMLAFSYGQSKNGLRWFDASGKPLIFC